MQPLPEINKNTDVRRVKLNHRILKKQENLDKDQIEAIDHTNETFRFQS